MNNIKIILSFNERLIQNKDAGELYHVFGEGYCILNEKGNMENTFNDEKEFNRVIEKYKYRYLLIEKLKNEHDNKIDFGTDNILIVNGKIIEDTYFNLPKNKNEVDLYFKFISDKF